MWNPQLEELERRLTVIRYEHALRGSVAELAEPLLEALGRVGMDRVSFCGLSLGAMVGMWIAAERPDRIDRLVLACTSARFGVRSQWATRARFVRAHGIGQVAREALDRWFTPAYVDRQPFLDMQLAFAPEEYALGLEAIDGFDFQKRLNKIQIPTLMITSADDTATTPDEGAALVDGIPGSRLVVLDHAAHLANVEAPRAFTLAVLEHLW